VNCWRCGRKVEEDSLNCVQCGAKLIKSLDTFFRLRKPLKVYYFSYGYTRDPMRMTKEVQKKVHEILLKRDDILPVVPHFIFDALFNFPKGYTHPEMAHWEAEIISRCDGVVYDPALVSAGCRWEVAIAQKLGVPVWTYDEVLEGRDLK